MRIVYLFGKIEIQTEMFTFIKIHILKVILKDGKIKGKNLEFKKDSYFGTDSHKLGIIWASWNYGAYFSFYKGGKRTFYMLPYTNGLLYNNGYFASEG